MHKDLRESILILRAEREAMLESLSTLQDEHKAISLALDESFRSRDDIQYKTGTFILQHEEVIKQYETRISQRVIEYDKVKCHYENEREQLFTELDQLKVVLEATNDLRSNRPLVS